MNYYKFLYLFWLLPAYLLFLTGHQVGVYFSLQDTYDNGTSYTSNVVDFEIKQIASQTNGYVVLEFTRKDSTTIRRKLSLPVQLASQIMDTKIIPIRYQQGAWEDVVMMPTYDVHKKMVLINAAITLVSFIVTIFIALYAHRFANRKLSGEDPDEELKIERIDQ